ncbi:hypothetical protein AMK06_PD00313 (plasmid) [Rhizobium sp. N541]|nr:hypothetical protein AMK05_PD00311 [Rhizobium sp. N324]ANM20592.1 hypothetical protein AMK06_PD00313 [Rhizobium sp. N541]ANM26976.1 hypothetical protein AMK07_PD00313 [Rhizobium sp. N941]OYD00381.1 hypothetical protein AMK08_PD00311 [Rhizobium sp. N4311]
MPLIFIRNFFCLERRAVELCSAYCCQPLKAFAKNPVWTADPVHAPYARASEKLRPNGYAGPLGYASAATMADYVLVDMYAAAPS